MTGIPCAFVYAHPALGHGGRCGRYVARALAVQGQRYCAVHDPASKAKTRDAHVARQARRALERPRPPLSFRDARIIELKELSIYWDGPGSEGREV